jgi:CubicO group peptidase (beta-lactamase class C family)
MILKKILFTLSVAIVIVIGGCSGKSMELSVPSANEGESFSQNLPWWRRAAMDAFMRYSVWSGSRSGFVAMIAHEGELIYSNAVGWANIETKIPMRLDTKMRFASMTKPITAVAAMLLIEEGKLGLDDPVSKYIPEFTNTRIALNENKNTSGSFDTAPLKNPMVVRHLLLFSSGVGPGYSASTDLMRHWKANGIRSKRSGDLAERVSSLARLPLFEEPGTRWRYGSSADILARVVEVASGEDYDKFLKRRIFEPLGMMSTSFRHSVVNQHELAEVYTQSEGGDLAVAPKSIDVDWNQGGSGLVSTAGDYMRFALMLWNKGQYQDVRILPEATISEMTRPHLPRGVFAYRGVKGLGWGLGMSVKAGEDGRLPGHDGDFGWGGYYGTTFFVSPNTGLVGIVLSQNELSEFSDGYQKDIYVVQGLAIP